MTSLKTRVGAVFAICLHLSTHLHVCDSKAINIAYTDDNGKLRLNLSSISKILQRPEIQEKELMVVSIVGEMRTGKSFISGYPIRYLQNKGWRNESWMGDGQTKQEGFNWAPGTETNTTGIDLWDKPFIIKKADGEEVAVLLLDTQGLFDFETTMDNNVRMNAINFLATSFLIMNFQKQLTERDLQNWQHSADWAKMASSVGEQVFELPVCLVLVQNWANPHEHAFGLDGGKTYKNYALAMRKNKPKLNSVRRNIASSFPSIEFFLMPHPGENVTRVTFCGTNNEVNNTYLKFVKKYVEHIFSPKHLAIKQLQGKPMTPKLYYDFLVTVDKALSSDKMPTAGDLVEYLAEAVYSGKHRQCLEEFQADMQGHVNMEGIIGRKEFKKLYESHKQPSMSCYKSTRTIGSHEIRVKYANKFRSDMEVQFQIMEKEMDAKREQHLFHTVDDLCKAFRKAIDEISDNEPTNVDFFQRSYSTIRALKIESYDEKSLKCEPYVAEFRKKLEDQIDEYYQRAHKVMQERRAEEMKRQEIQRQKEAAEKETERAIARKDEADRQAQAALDREQKALKKAHKKKKKGKIVSFFFEFVDLIHSHFFDKDK